MRSILVNIGLVPVLFLAGPLIILLSFAPPAGRMQRFRRWMSDWLDKITNDYGAELIYLADPSGGDNDAEILKDPSPAPGHGAAAQTTLIIVPARRSTTRSPKT
jgi:hypothetical protein